MEAKPLCSSWVITGLLHGYLHLLGCPNCGRDRCCTCSLDHFIRGPPYAQENLPAQPTTVFTRSSYIYIHFNMIIVCQVLHNRCINSIAVSEAR